MIAVHGTIQAVINELEPGDPAVIELDELRRAVINLIRVVDIHCDAAAQSGPRPSDLMAALKPFSSTYAQD